jgi:ribosome biogenesis protein BMS1
VSRKELIRKRESKLPVKAVMSDKEKDVYAMIQRLNTVKREKVAIQCNRLGT